MTILRYPSDIPGQLVNALSNNYSILTGDGVANDQPALASLVSQLSTLYVADGHPRVIYCPAGAYSIRDAGTLWKSGVSLVGDGPGATRFVLSNPVATTNPTPLATYTVAQGAATTAPLTDCTFANFEVDGSGVALAAYNSGAKAFVMQFMVRARFFNLYLHDCAATALGCDFLQDSIINNVVATGNGRLNNGSQPGGAGIGIGIGGWGSIERTLVANCVTTGNGTHGIFVELQSNTYTRPRGIRIAGCHSEGNRHGISDYGADGLIVSACSLIGNSVNGFEVSQSGVAGIAGQGGVLTGSVIDGNTLDGVLIGETPGKYTVRGNRISGSSQHGVHLASVTQPATYAVSEFVVSENDIYGNAQCGIRTDCVMTDGFITNNRIRNNGTATAQTTDLRSGISLNTAANSPTILGNRCWDNQGTKTQTYGWYITAGGTAGSATAVGNNLNGNLISGYNFLGSVTGGMWSQNLGMAPNLTSAAQTAITDGNALVAGQLRYLAFIRNWVSGTLAPSATPNTNGTALVCSPSAGQQGFQSFSLLSVVFAGTISAETITATFTSTFSDSTNGSGSLTATATGRVNMAGSGTIVLLKDGVYVTSVSVSLQSTKASSLATATVNIIGVQN